jgi:glutathione S-transferase
LPVLAEEVSLKLYYSPGACSLSPHIVLCECGFTYELEQVDLRTKKTKSGADFLAINPKGQVPALILDDGSLLTEGPAIVQFIADVDPDSGLAPLNGTRERYHLQEWLNFISTELHKNFAPLFRPTTPDEYKKIVREALAAKFAFVDARLAKHQFLLGDHFTAADSYLFVMTLWAGKLHVDLPENVATFKARVMARPRVHQAMREEGLI